MASRIFLPVDIADDFEVVRVGGRCYERVGPSSREPDTQSIENSFETCEDCESSSSTSDSGGSNSTDPCYCVYLHDEHAGDDGNCSEGGTSGICTTIVNPPEVLCPKEQDPSQDPIEFTLRRTADANYGPCPGQINLTIDLPNADMTIDSTDPPTPVRFDGPSVSVWWPQASISSGETQDYTVSITINTMDASDCYGEGTFKVTAVGCEDSTWVVEYECRYC